MRFTSQQDVEYARVMEVPAARVKSAGGARRLKGLSDEVQRMLLKMAPKKRAGKGDCGGLRGTDRGDRRQEAANGALEGQGRVLSGGGDRVRA